MRLQLRVFNFTSLASRPRLRNVNFAASPSRLRLQLAGFRFAASISRLRVRFSTSRFWLRGRGFASRFFLLRLRNASRLRLRGYLFLASVFEFAAVALRLRHCGFDISFSASRFAVSVFSIMASSFAALGFAFRFVVSASRLQLRVFGFAIPTASASRRRLRIFGFAVALTSSLQLRDFRYAASVSMFRLRDFGFERHHVRMSRHHERRHFRGRCHSCLCWRNVHAERRSPWCCRFSRRRRCVHCAVECVRDRRGAQIVTRSRVR